MYTQILSHSTHPYDTPLPYLIIPLRKIKNSNLWQITYLVFHHPMCPTPTLHSRFLLTHPHHNRNKKKEKYIHTENSLIIRSSLPPLTEWATKFLIHSNFFIFSLSTQQYMGKGEKNWEKEIREMREEWSSHLYSSTKLIVPVISPEHLYFQLKITDRRNPLSKNPLKMIKTPASPKIHKIDDQRSTPSKWVQTTIKTTLSQFFWRLVRPYYLAP